MSGRLIIIRGNSGSGKTTIASRLRYELGYGTMLIPQDVIRREIVRVSDEPLNPAIKLIDDIARYGNSIGYDVIIEGILTRDKYGEMLVRLSKDFTETHAFYLDVSFEETLHRHQTKSKKNEFGEKEMREWWVEKDYLRIKDETIIHENVSEDEVLSKILFALNSSKSSKLIY